MSTNETDAPGTAWPRRAEDLADTTRCPACFRPILPTPAGGPPTECAGCGLALTDRRLASVLTLGQNILGLERERRAVLDEVRAAQAALATAPQAASVTAAHVAAAPAAQLPAARISAAPPALPTLAVDAPSGATSPASPRPRVAADGPRPEPIAPPRTPRRRITVPMLLLIVGVCLVGIAAIFFLTVAWFVATMAVRALIVGAVTLATIATATFLRRRALTSTAEGVAVIGVVLLALDAWGARANGLFGADASDPVLYAGAAALAVGALCRLWARVSRLRAPDVAAVLGVPTGVALLAAGASGLSPAPAAIVGLAAAAAGALTFALPAPWSAARAESRGERTALASIGVAALASTLGGSFLVAYDGVGFVLWIVPALVILAAAWWIVLGRRATTIAEGWAPLLATAVACIGVAGAATWGWQLALREPWPWQISVAGPVVAAAVAVVADRVRLRRGLPAQAVVAAGGIAGVGALLTAASWVASGAEAIGRRWALWHTDAVAALAPGALPALVGGAALAAALWFAPSLRRGALRTARPTASAVVVLAAALATAVPAIVVGVGVLVCAAAVGIARSDRRPAAWAAAAVLGGATAYAAGLSSPALWTLAAVAAILTPIAVAVASRATPREGAQLSIAAVLIAAMSALVAPSAIAAVIEDASGSVHAGGALVQWVALAALTLALVGARRGARHGNDGENDGRGRALVPRALAASGLVLTAASVLPVLIGAAAAPGSVPRAGAVAAAIGEPWAGIVRGAALIAVLGALAWATWRHGSGSAEGARSRVDGIRTFAGILLSPATAALAVTAVGIVGGAEFLAPLTVGSAAALCLIAAVVSMRRPTVDAVASAPWNVRVGVDLGAIATIILVGGTAPRSLAGVTVLLVAATATAMSVTRGWAAPRSHALPGVPSSGSAGAPLGAAPRRLLVWVSLALASGALWTILATATPTVPTREAYALPPAIALALLATALTWLRRHTEAAIAVGLAVLAGVGVPALTVVHDPTRTIVTTLVAAALCAVPAWTAVRRVPAASVSLAVTSLAIATPGALVMSMWAGSAHAAWAALPAAAAFSAGAAFARVAQTRPRPSALADPDSAPVASPVVAGTVGASRRVAQPGAPARVAQHAFAVGAPAIATVLGGTTVALRVFLHTDGLIAAVALVTLLGLSVAAAAVNIAPLGAATRWASAGAAALVAGAILPAVDPVELVSAPVGIAVLAGAALAMRRLARSTDAAAPWPEAERAPWLAGIAVAVVPSVLAPAHAGRAWLGVAAVLLAAVGLAVVAGVRAMRLAAASIAILASAAVAMGLRAAIELTTGAGLAIALVAGGGVTALAAVLVWRRFAPPLPALAAAAGTGLAAVTVALRGDGSALQSGLIAVCATAAACAVAAQLARPRWWAVAGVVTLGSTLTAVAAIGLRFVVCVASGAGLEPDAWVLAGAVAVGLVGLVALRASRNDALAASVDDPRPGGAPLRAASTTTRVVAGVFAASAVTAAVAQSVLLMTGLSDDGPVRAGIAVALLSAAAVSATLARPRLGPAPALAGVIAVVIVAATALLVGAARPVEVVTAAPAVGLIVLGVRRLRMEPSARSWPSLGPGLALLTAPSLLHDVGPNALWRIVALGLVALALVVIGATRRLQAPLVIGTVVLLVHGVAQLWPWIALSYTAVPWWLWVGAGGILLIVIAARYERQLIALKKAYAGVASLR
ncbi:SCO7613 C-terminal domain-containing membrane protein [Microbacterium dextranolyticum]|uniref:DUF2157 domain-containing protein n=1 Tax=Microbacterium dextranolyticum TaxID=36806 RepID=A0A9W6HJU7_9MICO|nr:hypothetical protein [Microbacterium dextranolyticum]MBM7461759.1 hypothetical protein [Microbacterium dextranolyticum]GLJ94000.1 hypothetical protein GCM10017591_00610 [Microbacterium dextranolyticum]